MTRSRPRDEFDEDSALDLEELRDLQVELVKLLQTVRAEGRRIAILFEGRDTAGKGGTIFQFTRYLNPKSARTAALPAPSDVERGQWYFQRYLRHLPNRGEIVFFDRSWYNRAVVEPVMGFCTREQHEQFLRQVVEVERMLIEDGIALIKFWFSIGAHEQRRRLHSRETDPLKRWKLSTVDAVAQQRWDDYTRYKERMFLYTHTAQSPWVIVDGNDKSKARTESMRYVLSILDYEGKDQAAVRIEPDASIVAPYDGPVEASVLPE